MSMNLRGCYGKVNVDILSVLFPGATMLNWNHVLFPVCPTAIRTRRPRVGPGTDMQNPAPPPLPPEVTISIWKMSNMLNKIMDIKFHIAFVRRDRSKGAFWTPKNSTFIKCGQICRVDWNWFGAHFITWMTFFVQFLVFEIWSISFFLRDLAEINHKIVNIIWFRLNDNFLLHVS